MSRRGRRGRLGTAPRGPTIHTQSNEQRTDSPSAAVAVAADSDDNDVETMIQESIAVVATTPTPDERVLATAPYNEQRELTTENRKQNNQKKILS
jgi:hypothetical protein